MPIIRVTRKQIEAANKAREAALKKDEDFRRFEEQRKRFEAAAKGIAKPPRRKLIFTVSVPTSLSTARRISRRCARATGFSSSTVSPPTRISIIRNGPTAKTRNILNALLT